MYIVLAIVCLISLNKVYIKIFLDVLTNIVVMSL